MGDAQRVEKDSEDTPISDFLEERGLTDAIGPLLPETVMHPEGTVMLKHAEIVHLDSLLEGNLDPLDPVGAHRVVIYIRLKVNSGRHRRELEELKNLRGEVAELRALIEQRVLPALEQTNENPD
jgi:hypothetical protein